jgi:hypothetical protein
MDARELRIGNCIKIGNIVTLVEGVSTWDNLIQNSNFAERHITEFEPIPLTEEWLLKFGFNKISDSYGINISISSYILTTVALLYSIDIFKKTNVYYGLIEIKHVHQLQNLYFALTGEELTIKE